MQHMLLPRSAPGNALMPSSFIFSLSITYTNVGIQCRFSYFCLMTFIFPDSPGDIRRKVEDIGCSYRFRKRFVLCKEKIIFLCKDQLITISYTKV